MIYFISACIPRQLPQAQSPDQRDKTQWGKVLERIKAQTFNNCNLRVRNGLSNVISIVFKKFIQR